MSDYDEKEDLMDRLLAMGRGKKFLSFDELNREMPDNMMSPEDIEDVLKAVWKARIFRFPIRIRRCSNRPRASRSTTIRKLTKTTSISIYPPERSINRTIRCVFTCAKWASCRF
jgi:hypothetical protein